MPKETFLRFRDEKQERIIRAAIHEFKEQGFERAKITVIAKNSKVAAGSLYQYFEDKKDLYVYCVEWSTKTLYNTLFAYMDISDIDYFEYMQKYLSTIKNMKGDSELIQFLLQMESEKVLINESEQAAVKVGADYWKLLIKNSKRKGTVRNDINEDLLFDYFVAISERFTKRFIEKWDFISELNEEQEKDIQREIDQLIDFLRNGMGC